MSLFVIPVLLPATLALREADFSVCREIKKKLIDSAAVTPGANQNVNLDKQGQGKLGGGCCS